MNTFVDIDITIVGGGIAGLWLLSRLRALGYGAVLVEGSRLGAGQTLRSQGIIHGGTKYALQGEESGAARAVAEMPAVWRQCLAGQGEVDLSGAELLSDHQYLWTAEGSVTSRLLGFFASKAMKSRMESLDGQDFPEVFRHRRFQGRVYRLDEPVLAAGSLIEALARPHRDAILLNQSHAVLAADNSITLRADGLEPIALRAQRVILTAGVGNGFFGITNMQLRPLNMVMVRSPKLPGGLYAHCLGAGDLPRLTITSHRDREGRRVWYLGGGLAEQGIKRQRDQQIAAARKELSTLLPWVDLAGAEFATLRVDRAEPRQRHRSRPDQPGVFQAGSIITAWPVKLAMVPLMADQIVKLLRTDGIEPRHTDLTPFGAWPCPLVAPYPWDEAGVEWQR